jgi:hypothetical protein
MRRIVLATVVSTLAAVAISCADAVAPPTSAPQLAKSGTGAASKVAICHASGRADSPKFHQIEVSANAVSAHLGTHGTERAGHEVDYLVDPAWTPCPPPGLGTILVCKAVLPGIAPGTPFTFVVTGRNVPTRTVTVPAGGCVPIQYRVGTTVNIREAVPGNTLLTGVSVTPTNAVGPNAPAGSANVIAGIGTATATFTNRSTVAGVLTVCKVAGANVPVGTPFSFVIGGAPATIPAGVGPGGGCISGIRLAGPVQVVEDPLLGTSLASITVSPQGNAAVSVPNRTANAVVVPGVETRLTFTNTQP